MEIVELTKNIFIEKQESSPLGCEPPVCQKSIYTIYVKITIFRIPVLNIFYPSWNIDMLYSRLWWLQSMHTRQRITKERFVPIKCDCKTNNLRVAIAPWKSTRFCCTFLCIRILCWKGFFFLKWTSSLHKISQTFCPIW